MLKITDQRAAQAIQSKLNVECWDGTQDFYERKKQRTCKVWPYVYN